MEPADKMKLQEKAKDGNEAAFLLVEKFSNRWLAEVESDILVRLNKARDVDELIKIQADYHAAINFHESLSVVTINGKIAAKKLHEEQVKE